MMALHDPENIAKMPRSLFSEVLDSPEALKHKLLVRGVIRY